MPSEVNRCHEYDGSIWCHRLKGRGWCLGQRREELVLEAEEGDLGRSKKKEEAMSGKGGMFEVRCGR